MNLKNYYEKQNYSNFDVTSKVEFKFKFEYNFIFLSRIHDINKNNYIIYIMYILIHIQ